MSSRVPEISVIVSCSNDARVLPGCLESIFGQTSAPNFEVLIVDDASTDGTREVLDKIEDPRVRVVRHARHRGHVACLNEALPLTRGEVVARIDATHQCRPDFVRTVCDRLRWQRAASDVNDEFISLLMRDFISTPVFATRRNTWLDALPVPQGLAFSDWYVALMAARRGAVCYVGAAPADPHQSAGNPELTLARTRAEERSVFWLLDRIFEQVEATADLERAKRRARGTVYAAQFQNFAARYLALGYASEARRCFVAAARHRPAAPAKRIPARPSTGMTLVRAVR
jgi:hypothetical protein